MLTPPKNDQAAGYLLNADSMAAVESAWALLLPFTRRFAARLTRDSDNQADLLQQAQVTLMKIDPTRFDLRVSDERAYLTRSLLNDIWKTWGGPPEGFVDAVKDLGVDIGVQCVDQEAVNPGTTLEQDEQAA